MSYPKTPDLVIKIAESTEIFANYSPDAIFLDDEKVDFDFIKIDELKYQIIYQQKSYDILFLPTNKGHYELMINGKAVSLSVKDKISQVLENLGMDINVEEVANSVDAPMPGSILKLMVVVGKEVLEGEPLLILEAMKMENVIKSPRNGIIDKINIELNQSVEKGQQLISFE
ncbi:MAG: biotin carboxyl carrier protein [Cyclobacteriaceae bacterium]|jgi:biotin carboxyl carrier protein